MMFLLVVTLSSMVLAAIMSVIAWRIAAEERRRSEARVAALAEDIHAPAAEQPRAAAQSAGARRADIGLRAEPRPASFPAPRSAPRWDDLPLRPVDRASAAPELFATTEPGRAGSRLGIVAVGALVFAVGLALMIGLGRGLPRADGDALRRSRTAPIAGQTPAATAAPSAAAPAAVPLELVALGHERDSDRLTVRGVVRNPPSGAPVERLTAVVFAFNADGGFLATGRAIIDASAALRPGGESTFVVTVPGAGAVGRYRVSFRTDDRVVPHVDRRDPPKSPS